MSRIASALDYPTRPVRLLVGFAPAGTTDISARLAGQWLSDRLGQQFIIENRSGASSNIAAGAVVRAPPDGYTLLVVTGANAINATLYSNLDFDFIRDIVPVAGIMRPPSVMVVNSSFPAKTVPEFIAYAKAHPRKLNMGTGGPGTSLHVFGELFKMMAGVDLVPVAYRGGAPALVDLLGGQVQVIFDPLPEAIGYIRAGQLRALAVTSAARAPALPDVPTVGEFVPGFEGSGFFGVGAPKNTPPEIVDRLNREINAALADPKNQARIIELGGIPMPMTPAEFGQLIAEQTEKWGKVIRAANIKLE